MNILRSRRSRTTLLLALVLMVLPATIAVAGKSDHLEARELLRRGQIVPLARILGIVRQRVPGDVIEVELQHDDGVWEYEVKVLTANGRVREIELDARDATVLKVEDD